MLQETQQSSYLIKKTEVQHQSNVNFSIFKLWLYVLSLSMGSFQLGFALSIYNPISKVLMKKYSFQCNNCWGIDKSHREPFNTIVSISLFISAFLSAFFSNFVIKRSRIQSFYLFNTLIVLGCSLQLFLRLPLLIIGRSLQGLGVGGFTTLIPLMINEISPPIIRGRTGTIFQIMINVGILFSAGLGIIALPYHASEITRDGNNLMWRIVIGFPILIGLISFLLFMFCYNFDTPQKYIEKFQQQSARQALKIVYSDNYSVEARLKQIQTESSNIKEPKLTDNPRIVIWIGVILGILQQLSGINSITFYSAQIFENNYDLQNIYTGNLVAILAAIVGVLASSIALFLIDRCGRKILLVIGFILMTLSMLCTGLFIQANQQNLQKISVMVFMVGFQISTGSVLWVYLPEILNASAILISMAAFWLALIVVSFTVPLMHSYKALMFIIFAGFNFLGLLFMIFFIIQTKGKSKKQVQQEYVRKFSRQKD